MKIDNELMYRFFMNENTEEEAERLGQWLKESEENEKEFRDAYKIFLVSQMSLASDSSSLEMRAAAPVKRRAWRAAAWIGGIAASLAIGFFVSEHYFTKPIRDLVESSSLAFSNRPEQITTFTLSDGSTVNLNADSRLECPAVFYGDERRVRLEGEAIFNVEKDPEKPFIVETYRYDIKVHGTRFDVIAEEENGRFSAALMEGSISLTDRKTGEEYLMVPNTVASLNNGRIEISGLEKTDSYLWTEGIISADGLPFDRLMEEFEKYYDVKIVIRKETLPEIGFGRLKLRISDGIATALNILEKTTDFKWTYDNTENIVYID